METRIIVFDIACKQCKTIRPTGILTLWDDEPIEDLGREELIKEMGNFKNIACDNCDTKGKWTCFNIYFEGQNEVSKQLTVNITEKRRQITGSISGGSFTLAEIDLALMKINRELDKLDQSDIIDQDEVSVYIQVDFLKTETFCRCSIIDARGIDIADLRDMVNIVFTDNVTQRIKK